MHQANKNEKHQDALGSARSSNGSVSIGRDIENLSSVEKLVMLKKSNFAKF